MFLGGAGVWGFGNESDNTLAGGTLGNFLFGRGGNDYLNGGGGADYLEGGAGADVFLFARGEANGDAVADFTPGQDRLGFIGYGPGGTFTQVDATRLGRELRRRHHARDHQLLQRPEHHPGRLLLHLRRRTLSGGQSRGWTAARFCRRGPPRHQPW